jgi:TrpR-related protein YerC/YecD
MKNWKTPLVSELFSDMTHLKNESEISEFMRDLCTTSELNEMAKRWKSAKMLNDGISIRKISEETGLSTTTISRVNQWKNSVGDGGYDMLLGKLEKISGK